MKSLFFSLSLLSVNSLFGASIDFGGAKSDINPIAIGMFLAFVLATLFITYLSNKKSLNGFQARGVTRLSV